MQANLLIVVWGGKEEDKGGDGCSVVDAIVWYIIWCLMGVKNFVNFASIQVFTAILYLFNQFKLVKLSLGYVVIPHS